MAVWNKTGILVTLLVLCAVGAIFWRSAPRPEHQSVAAPPAADPATLPLILQGRSYCAVSLPVPVGMPGEVEEIYVSIGQTVKKDDPLFKLKLSINDATALAARLNKGTSLRTLEANIAQQEIRLAQLERNLNEARQMEALGMAARNTLADLQDQQRMAASQLELARANLADARRAAADDIAVLTKMLGQPLQSGAKPVNVMVRAPQDGNVISIEPSVQKGATITGTICTLGTMDPMIIRGQVHESELGRLQNSTNATIALDGGKGESFEASLSRVSWAALDPSLAAPAYYLFELVVPNPGNKIKDGFKVQVTLSPPKKDAARPAPAQ